MSGKYNLYISLALNGLALQYLWLYHAPAWMKNVFSSTEEAEPNPRWVGEDLMTAAGVFDQLSKFALERDPKLSMIPIHRLQLALAAYLVRVNQDDWREQG